jgi:heptosyltransferase-2
VLARTSRTSLARGSRGLVVQTAFPGDVILSTPLIRRAAERLGAPVDVVVIPAGVAVLQNNPHIRDIIVYDKKGKDAGLRPFLALVRKLRARQYAVAYHAQASPRSAALTFLARVPRRIGFRGAKGAWFYTHAVMERGEVHQVEKLLRLADGAPERREPEIYPSAGDRETVGLLLEEAGIAGEFVALAPGSAWATKRWPYFPELARAIADAERLPLAIVGGPGDRADARAIRQAVGNAVPIADGTTALTMLQSGELVRRARLLVSGDTAPVHLASAVDTPVVEIYGPTVPQFGFAARPALSRFVEPDPLPCRPCHHHGPAICPQVHHRCMRDTPISRVLAEVRTVLHNLRTRAKDRR